MFKNVMLTVDLNAKASWEKALPQAVELVRQSGGVLHSTCLFIRLETF